MDKRFFYKQMGTFVVPITLQLLITSGLSTIDSLMVGRLGVTAIASVGIANKIIQFIIVFLQGISSGATIFASQFYGKKEMNGFRVALRLICFLSLIISLIFAIFILFFSNTLVRLFTLSSVVMEKSTQFLMIQAITFPFIALTMIMTVGLKSIGEVKIPTFFALITLVCNTSLNGILIYGMLGSPKLGITGAAIATLISRCLQFILIFLFAKKKKILNNDTYDQKREFIINFLQVTAPALINHLTWTLGDMVFFLIFSKVSTQMTASVSLIDPLVFIFTCIYTGISDASSVMIGQLLGAKKYDLCKLYAKNFIKITFVASIISALLIFSFSPFLIKLYHLDPETTLLTKRLLAIYASLIIFKNLNYINNVGILRVGGDTKFVMWLDTIAVWCISIPICIFSLVNNYPPSYIYLFALSHEIIRCIVGIYRTFSYKWIHTLI